jgi:2,4-dienoyl-CoA reductase-like NADH-dependent reductase (Old Yellow Enzyme family)
MLGLDLPLAAPDSVAATLGAPLTVGRHTLANRFAVLPMEGWDGTTDGRPTELVQRRWERFGASGAALIWGGEAVAVRADGRANPRQLCIGPHSTGDLSALRAALLAGHPGPPPLVGLQLTHSGRWSRPVDVAAPRVAYRHPWLDERVGVNEQHVFTDTELDDLIADFVRAAVVAAEAGFDFVDVKHCHGYLLHELLSAVDRPGAYGGSLANRMRFLDSVVAGIHRDAPDLDVGVRVSAFDLAPHRAGPDGRGEPLHDGPYRYAFGGDGTGIGVDLSEVHEMCAHLRDLDVALLCVTAGSPYYCPHAQRPAYFPPSDGYLPPNDPLLDVARLLDATREVARRHPSLAVVASGCSYLQEWMPAVGAALVADGVACIGYGRGVLAYPDLPLDVLHGTTLTREKLCRTFSDCTTAPRNGLVSGCYPIDDFYKGHPDRVALTRAKRAATAARGGRRTR